MARRSYPDLVVFEDVAPRSLGCFGCTELGECGGRYVPGDIFSCTDACDSGTCRPGCVSPKHPERYHRALMEVGGFGFEDLDPIRCPDPKHLPDSLPVLQHGSLSKRSPAVRSALKWVAVPLRAVIRFPSRGGKGRPSWRETYRDAASFRHAFGLAPTSKVVLVCVDKDKRIEPVWRDYNKPGFMDYFRRLGLAAVIPPNFSLYDHEPWAQHQHNRKRSLILAEEFSRFGIPVVPNFHALGPGDRVFWKKFLQARPEITCIAEEFQTGLRHPKRGEAAIDEIARLQDELRRPIHLVAIGASRLTERIKLRFEFSSWTMVSSQPFLLAINRMRMYERASRSFGREPVSDDTDRSSLLLDNVRLHTRLSKGRRHRSKRRGFSRRPTHSVAGTRQARQSGEPNLVAGASVGPDGPQRDSKLRSSP